MPNSPSFTASMASIPKRVASTRSYAVGVPPRRTCPRIVTRVSNPVRRSISGARSLLIPPRRTCPNSSVSADWSAIVPSTGTAPSATTTIEKLAPRRCRCWMRSHTSPMSNGSSGTRMMSAPPAIPEYVAIQPAWRPITSTTITRSWLSAVVWSRSMASVAICTAVLNPNVKSVAERSLSIVFGTPTRFDAVGAELGGDAERVLAADRRSARRSAHVRACRAPRATPSSVLYGFVRELPRIVPPRWSSPRVLAVVRSTVSQLDDTTPAVSEPDEVVPVDAFALADDGADHRVEPRAVATAGEHADPHLHLRQHVSLHAGAPSILPQRRRSAEGLGGDR